MQDATASLYAHYNSQKKAVVAGVYQIHCFDRFTLEKSSYIIAVM
jgi:hypothetical protein